MDKIICFDKNLLRADAFRSLSKWSMLVYLDFLRKRQMEKVKRKNRKAEWSIKNNGDIVYPYIEAEGKGIGRREFRNAIDELIEKGFLDITHQGSGGRSADMTRYLIDDRWPDYGTPSFKPAKNPRKKDKRKGVGWSAFHASRKKSSVTNPSLAKPDSSDKSVTPKNNDRSLSHNISVTPKPKKKASTSCFSEDNDISAQLPLWSNEIDTIL
ncbi:MAG: hypothetical protein C0618_05710 [Desulfuromonas sp.]|nr:MAG: hypothetical protein C0618_05710 [Desulfuromonas sp.]